VQSWGALLYYTPGDSGDVETDSHLLQIALAVNGSYSGSNMQTAQCKLVVAYVGETIELSSVASALGRTPGGLYAPKNKAMFHMLGQLRKDKVDAAFDKQRQRVKDDAKKRALKPLPPSEVKMLKPANDFKSISGPTLVVRQSDDFDIVDGPAPRWDFIVDDDHWASTVANAKPGARLNDEKRIVGPYAAVEAYIASAARADLSPHVSLRPKTRLFGPRAWARANIRRIERGWQFEILSFNSIPTSTPK